MKTILVPLALDSTTLPLLRYSEPIARDMGASLVLLHVVPKQAYDNGTFSPEAKVHESVVAQTRQVLERLSHRVMQSGIRNRVMILDGDPADTIVRTARDTRADIIVLSRACGEAHCTSARVLAEAPCPVLSLIPVP